MKSLSFPLRQGVVEPDPKGSTVVRPVRGRLCPTELAVAAIREIVKMRKRPEVMSECFGRINIPNLVAIGIVVHGRTAGHSIRLFGKETASEVGHQRSRSRVIPSVIQKILVGSQF